MKRSTIMHSRITMESQRASHRMFPDEDGKPQPDREFPVFDHPPEFMWAGNGKTASRIKLTWSWEWRGFCADKLDRNDMIRIPVHEFRSYRTIGGLLLRLRAAAWLGTRSRVVLKIRPDRMNMLSGFAGPIARMSQFTSYVAKGLPEVDRLCFEFDVYVDHFFSSTGRYMAMGLDVCRLNKTRSRAKSRETDTEPPTVSYGKAAPQTKATRLPATRGTDMNDNDEGRWYLVTTEGGEDHYAFGTQEDCDEFIADWNAQPWPGTKSATPVSAELNEILEEWPGFDGYEGSALWILAEELRPTVNFN